MIDRIYYLLLAGMVEVVFEPLPYGVFGLCNTDTGIVSIDPKQDNPIATLLHECIHILDPTLDELEVETRTQEMFANLSPPEYRWLYRFLRKRGMPKLIYKRGGEKDEEEQALLSGQEDSEEKTS